MQRQKLQMKASTALAVVTAVLYCSWPLGYVLNPIAAQKSLASGLEGAHQPYNWVFTSSDVLSGIAVLLLAAWLWQRYRQSGARLLTTALAMVGAFGLGTIIDAALPERCVPRLHACPNFTQDHLLLVHGLFSIAASFALFVSLCLLWWRNRRSRLLGVLMIGYLLFGFISFIEAVVPGDEGNWSQHYYITLCSVWIALLPYAVRRQFGSVVEEV